MLGRGKAAAGQAGPLGFDRIGAGDFDAEVVEAAALAGVLQQHQLQRRLGDGEVGVAGPPPRDLLADKGFAGTAFAAAQAARGTAVLVPPAKNQRAAMPAILLTVIARWRNRIEVSFSEITDLMGLAWHRAHTFWGLLTRTAATIGAHTLQRVCLAVA
jgi:hypothetical protein